MHTRRRIGDVELFHHCILLRMHCTLCQKTIFVPKFLTTGQFWQIYTIEKFRYFLPLKIVNLGTKTQIQVDYFSFSTSFESLDKNWLFETLCIVWKSPKNIILQYCKERSFVYSHSDNQKNGANINFGAKIQKWDILSNLQTVWGIRWFTGFCKINKRIGFSHLVDRH